MDENELADQAAADVWAKLVAGREGRVADLGSFTVREYKAYEGRHPWTGETVHVPAKKLPFFKIDKPTRDFLDGSGATPRTEWVAALVARLMERGAVPFGRVGTFVVRTKLERRGVDPQTNTEIVIPARHVLTCTPSRQVVRAMNGNPALEPVDATELAAALERLPTTPPTTVEELRAALAAAGIDPSRGGLAPPDAREGDDTIVAFDLDGIPQWFSNGVSVYESVDSDEERVEVPISGWVADMLVIATVRAVAHDKALSGRDVQRVLAQLSATTPFSIRDLPF